MKVKFTSYNNLKRALVLAILFLPVLAFSQSKRERNIEYLKATNGYHGIKLGSDINSIPDYKLSFLDGNDQVDADSCITYAYRDDDMLKADTDLRLTQIGIRTYKNKIVNIYLFFDIKDSYKILRAFLREYGQFTDLPYEYTDIYDWNSKLVNLSLRYPVKTENGVAVYTCNSIAQDIDKAKESQHVIDNALGSLASTLPADGNIKKAAR